MFASIREKRICNLTKFIKWSKKELRIHLVLGILFSVVICPQPILADQIDQPVKFSVRAVQSDKQVNKNVSYFDLLLSPGEDHILEVDIFNSGDNPINTLINAYTAGTSSGGIIDYYNANVTDDSLKVSFADAANVETPILSIPANDSTRASIKISMPDISFDGIMLGGIVIKKAEDENSHISSEEPVGTNIVNEYCYVIGVRIKVNDTKVEPDFRLRYVEPTLSNYHTSIAANLQNFEAALVKGLKIDANIYFDNETEPLYTSSNSDFDVAPNSNFDYIIPCSGALAVGDYRLKLTAALGEKLWEFDESFTISESVADNINNKAVNIPQTNYYRIATICLAVLLVIVIVSILIYIIFFKNKKKDSND